MSPLSKLRSFRSIHGDSITLVAIVLACVMKPVAVVPTVRSEDESLIVESAGGGYLHQ